jgi:hypothetical protein
MNDLTPLCEIVTDWRSTLRRRDISELRHCKNPESALMLPSTWDLLKRITPYWPENQEILIGCLAVSLAWANVGYKYNLSEQIALIIPDSDKRRSRSHTGRNIDEWRYIRLLTSRHEDDVYELLVTISRVATQKGDGANWCNLAYIALGLAEKFESGDARRIREMAVKFYSELDA